MSGIGDGLKGFFRGVGEGFSTLIDEIKAAPGRVKVFRDEDLPRVSSALQGIAHNIISAARPSSTSSSATRERPLSARSVSAESLEVVAAKSSLTRFKERLFATGRFGRIFFRDQCDTAKNKVGDVVTFSNNENGISSEYLDKRSIDMLCVPHLKNRLVRDEKMLGGGSFGKVFQFTYGPDNKQAVKKTPNHIETLEQLREWNQEVALMAKLKGKLGVVQLLWIEKDEVKINGKKHVVYHPIMEFCSGGSVERCLKESTPPTSSQKLKMAKNIAQGLCSLHEVGIVHRDLAARNVLMRGAGEFVVCDFGLSRFLLENQDSGIASSKNVDKGLKMKGPLKWMAPEALIENKYSAKSDVWAFSVTLIEIYTGQVPYPNMIPSEAAFNVAKGHRQDLTEVKMPAQVGELIKRCQNENPNERPTMAEVLAQLQEIELSE